MSAFVPQSFRSQGTTVCANAAATVQPGAVLVRASLAIGLAAVLLPAKAQTIVDEWAAIKAPPPPELKTVKVDPKRARSFCSTSSSRTAARVLVASPRCRRCRPAGKGRGRPACRFVYSIVTGQAPTDVLPEVAPRAGDALLWPQVPTSS